MVLYTYIKFLTQYGPLKIKVCMKSTYTKSNKLKGQCHQRFGWDNPMSGCLRLKLRSFIHAEVSENFTVCLGTHWKFLHTCCKMLENSTIVKIHIGKFPYTVNVGKCWKIPLHVQEDIGEFLCICWKALKKLQWGYWKCLRNLCCLWMTTHVGKFRKALLFGPATSTIYVGILQQCGGSVAPPAPLRPPGLLELPTRRAPTPSERTTVSHLELRPRELFDMGSHTAKKTTCNLRIARNLSDSGMKISIPGHWNLFSRP